MTQSASADHRPNCLMLSALQNFVDYELPCTCLHLQRTCARCQQRISQTRSGTWVTAPGGPGCDRCFDDPVPHGPAEVHP